MAVTTVPDAGWLTTEERDTLLRCFERDGYVVLPHRVDESVTCRAAAALDRLAHDAGAEHDAFRVDDCLPLDSSFRELATQPAVLQLCCDLLGPFLHLLQSNALRRPSSPHARDDYRHASPWHADGPVPHHYPSVDGIPALLSIKVGVFLGDAIDPDQGALRVVPGSHRQALRTRELDVPADAFAARAAEARTIPMPRGGMVAFHHALWHAAPPNRSVTPRRNVYYTYGPVWVRPLDRELPARALPDDWTPLERLLQGEALPPPRFYLPRDEDLAPLAPYARTLTRAPGRYA